MSLEQILVIAFGIVAIIDIYLLRQVKRLDKAFGLMVNQLQNNTAIIFHFKGKFNISDEEYQQAVDDFNKMVEDFDKNE